MNLHHDGGELSVSDIASLGKVVTGINPCDSSVIINIGYVHDRGHKEAWFIAMDVQPTRKTTLDYGLRWNIESMFSDSKSRGFCLQHTRLQRKDRISRILLVLALALTWATANGYIEQKKTFWQNYQDRPFRSFLFLYANEDYDISSNVLNAA